MRSADSQLTLSNPSPFVVRLSQTVSIVSDNKNLTLLRTYVLPGESFSVAVPAAGLNSDVITLRFYPASHYGFDVGSFNSPLTR